MSNNTNMIKAKKAKKDEFYTRLEDIEQELKYYTNHFKNKIIYCNCDDSEKSSFYKYFYLKFDFFNLKKLICTSYNKDKTSYKTEVFKENDELKAIKSPLQQNGDFRSDECVELLKECDVVVTNPPFSLFRDFIDILMEHNKKFLIIGNMNAVTYKNIFSLIKDNKVWFGYNINKTVEFMVPKDYKFKKGKYRVDDYGNYYIKVPSISWFTNLEIDKKNEELILYKKYNDVDYPKYDNYDAINVDKIADIPCDYYGEMGVPITLLTKYNPNQFEIIDIDKNITSDNKRTLLNGKRKYARIIIKRKL